MKQPPRVARLTGTSWTSVTEREGWRHFYVIGVSRSDDGWRVELAASCDAHRRIMVTARELLSLMGASPATMLGAIIESGAADFTGLIRRRGMAVPSAFAPEVRAVFDPLPKLARGRVPLLVLHGGADEMISPREAQLTFDAAGTPAAHKTLCLLEGHGHNDVMRAPEYWVALKRFISSLPSR